MKPRSVEDWVTIIKTQTNGDPIQIANRIFGDIMGYGSQKRTIKNHGWRERDNQELANAITAFVIWHNQQGKVDKYEPIY